MRKKKSVDRLDFSDDEVKDRQPSLPKKEDLSTLASNKSRHLTSILDTTDDYASNQGKPFFLSRSSSKLNSPTSNAKSYSFLSPLNSRDASITKDSSIASKKEEYKQIIRNRQSLPSINKVMLLPKSPKSPSPDRVLGFLDETIEEPKTRLKRLGKVQKNARAIIKVYESLLESTLSFDNFYNTNEISVESSVKLAKSVCLGLENMQKIINATAAARKDKDKVERYLIALVSNSQKSRNNELYFASLKLQGKILFLFSDIYRAIQTFRYMKKLADRNNSYLNKLKGYKYLGKCFQGVGNHEMAIFYFVKFLQTAWLCNKRHYELLAYDLMAMQYYYLGDLDNARFFHDKLATGAVEPSDSELKKIGIEKLLEKMKEDPTLKKKKHPDKVKTVEEELTTTTPPSSEDEFEYPSHSTFKEKEDRQKESALINGIVVQVDKRQKKYFKAAQIEKAKQLRIKFQNPEYKRKILRKPMFVKDLGYSDVYYIRKKKESVVNPPKNEVLISHLSSNRFLNNFHMKDPRFLINAFVLDEPTTDGLVLLDAKSFHKMHLKLRAFHETLEDTIRYLELFSKNIIKFQSQTFKADIKRRLTRVNDEFYS